jgi:DNA-binding transcriptional LysR family regulator
MAELDWSDLRYALAVGATGGLAAAARQLGVNHTTALRRLDALELRSGARLFERARTGYLPTEAGALVLAQVRRMADQAEEIERQVAGRDRGLIGVLRVTTALVVTEHLLPTPLADFARAYPGIEVERVENAFMMYWARRYAEISSAWARREADVVLRLSKKLDDHLVGRPLKGIYCPVCTRRGSPGLLPLSAVILGLSVPVGTSTLSSRLLTARVLAVIQHVGDAVAVRLPPGPASGSVWP